MSVPSPALPSVSLDRDYTLDDKYTPQRGPDLPVRRAGAGAAAAHAADARPRRRAEHGRLHFRLPRLAAGRFRPGTVEGQEAPGRVQHRVHARPQRRPRRDHGLGHAADQSVRWREIRRRVLHVVRQGSGRRPLRRRVQARQCRRHLAPTAACWRWLPTTTPAARSTLPHGSELEFVSRDDAGAQPGRRAGHPRHGPARLGDVALHRALGRLQDHRRNGGVLGLGQRQSAPARHHHCRTTSRCRRAASTSAGRIRRSTRKCACTTTRCTPRIAFARANRLDKTVFDSPQGASGHRHHRQELPGCAAGAGIPRHRATRPPRTSASASTRSA